MRRDFVVARNIRFRRRWRYFRSADALTQRSSQAVPSAQRHCRRPQPGDQQPGTSIVEHPRSAIPAIRFACGDGEICGAVRP